MGHRSSKVGQRVDRIRVSDDPHDLYRADGTPVPVSTKIGKVIEKSVKAHTVTCVDCDIPARFTEKAEPVCPNCGLICAGPDGKNVIRRENLVIDAKAAGRISSPDP